MDVESRRRKDTRMTFSMLDQGWLLSPRAGVSNQYSADHWWSVGSRRLATAALRDQADTERNEFKLITPNVLI